MAINVEVRRVLERYKGAEEVVMTVDEVSLDSR
jgi:hypothetical protein